MAKKRKKLITTIVGGKSVGKTRLTEKLIKRKNSLKNLEVVFPKPNADKRPTGRDKLLKDLKAKLVSESEYSIKILKETVHIKSGITIMRIGHATKILEGNEIFLLLEKRVQEFMVVLTKNLLNRYVTDVRYFHADKKAFNYVFRKYPKVSKLYWLFAFKALLLHNNSELNMKRMKNILDEFFKSKPKTK